MKHVYINNVYLSDSFIDGKITSPTTIYDSSINIKTNLYWPNVSLKSVSLGHSGNSLIDRTLTVYCYENITNYVIDLRALNNCSYDIQTNTKTRSIYNKSLSNSINYTNSNSESLSHSRTSGSISISISRTNSRNIKPITSSRSNTLSFSQSLSVNTYSNSISMTNSLRIIKHISKTIVIIPEIIITKAETVIPQTALVVSAAVGGVSMSRFINLECYDTVQVAEMPFINIGQYGFGCFTICIIVVSMLLITKKSMCISIFSNIYMYYAGFIYKYITYGSIYSYVCCGVILIIGCINTYLIKMPYHPYKEESKFMYYPILETLLNIGQTILLAYRCDNYTKVGSMAVFIIISFLRPYIDMKDNIYMLIMGSFNLAGIYLNLDWFDIAQVVLALVPFAFFVYDKYVERTTVKITVAEDDTQEVLIAPVKNPLAA